MKHRRSVTIIATFLSLAMLFATTVPAQEAGNSVLSGKLLDADGKSPLSGAKVRLYHLSSEETFVSEPTGPDGKYTMEQLPFGYFDMAVETADGLFVANQVVNLPPSGKAVVSLTIAAFGTAATTPEDQARGFPGSTAETTGVARVTRKAKGREFWRSSKGVAIIAGGGALILLAIAASGSGDSSNPPVASASLPSQ